MTDDVVKRFRTLPGGGGSDGGSDGRGGETPAHSSPVPQTRALLRNHLEFGPLFKIVLTNLLLTIVTLGIYRFWAKTRLRRYLWGHVEIMGDRLEYTGTGKELFLGFLFIFVVILMPFFVGFGFLEVAMVDASEDAQGLVASLQTILIVFLFGVAFFRARRYRLTRTHWRGIYGNQTGSALKYGLMLLGCYFLTTVTLGLAWPVCSVWLKKYEMAHTWLGNQQPEFTPKASKLYGPFLIAWFGGLVLMGCGAALIALVANTSGIDFNDGSEPSGLAVLGIIVLVYASFLPFLSMFLWYRGKAYNHFVSSTRFLNHDVTSAITGGGFVWLTIGNILLMLFTVGLAAPIVYRRYLNFVERNVGLSGDGDFSALMQGEHEKPGTGEGLADAFDVGAI